MDLIFYLLLHVSLFAQFRELNLVSLLSRQLLFSYLRMMLYT
jgi:hypothetical protein